MHWSVALILPAAALRLEGSRASAMAAGRLSDSQKQELVQQYRAGMTSAALAEAFGCSPNTVSRTVKSLLSPEEYERLKKQRTRGGSAAAAAAAEPIAAVASVEPAAAPASSEPTPEEVIDEPSPAAAPVAVVSSVDETVEAIEEGSSLALDDADDFSPEDPEDDELNSLDEDDADVFVAIAPVSGIGEIGSSGPCVSKPLVISDLPSSLYLLVDREVELKGTPVKEFSELGAVAAEEEEHKAIALFANPRQAKRQCGRSQRVIKVPDSGLLERTAPFILAQGISRVVLDSTLYALPGS
mgnify:CR=1 FL=1